MLQVESRWFLKTITTFRSFLRNLLQRQFDAKFNLQVIWAMPTNIWATAGVWLLHRSLIDVTVAELQMPGISGDCVVFFAKLTPAIWVRCRLQLSSNMFEVFKAKKNIHGMHTCVCFFFLAITEYIITIHVLFAK